MPKLGTKSIKSISGVKNTGNGIIKADYGINPSIAAFFHDLSFFDSQF
jgi:hypothetical protein